MEPASIPSPVVRFGIFEADLRTLELRRNGVRIKMQDLPFRALRLFLSRPGEVVSRDDLRHALWPEDVYVDFDRGISSAVNRLRETLGDTAANPVFLETVERRGYRWIAPTHSPTDGSDKTPAAVAAKDAAALPTSATPQRSGTVVPISGTGYPTNSIEPTHPSLRIWAGLLLTLLVAAGGVLWVTHRGTAKPKPSQTAPRPSADAQAEDLYLKGRYYWNKRTPDDLNKAVDFFNLALARDPNYADAYVGLADCYNLLREFSAMPPDVAFPRALASAKKAVELDPNSAEAHASLGFSTLYWNWDRAAAEREFNRALELDPSSARAHHWWATTLLTMNRSPEALLQIEIAQKLDPSSAAILADKAAVLMVLGRRREAYALLHQVVDADATLASAHSYLASLYLGDNDYANYFAESGKAAELQHNQTAIAQNTAAQKAFSSGGLPAMYTALLPLQLAAYQQGRGQAFPLAETYSHLGQRTDALRMLREAYERREQPVLFLGANPEFAVLKGNPEYEDIVKKAQQPRG